MDRVELSVADVDRLLDWRDQHLAEVRSMPAPLKAIEIVFKHNDYRIKGIRNGNWLKLSLAKGYDSLGHVDMEIVDGLLHLRKGKLKCNEEGFQSCLTVYGSLMALMVYGERPVSEDPGVVENRPRMPHAKKDVKSQKRTTYILRNVNGNLMAMPRGSHASPSGIFTVRGHYRHCKSGKVVWIAEYKKGTGKKKRKTYKIGGIDSDERETGADVGSALRSESGDRLKSAD